MFKFIGGLYVVGLFNSEGKLLKLWEDVGRYNVLDKLIGLEFLVG